MENQRMDESIARKRRIQGLTTALALCLGMLSAGTAAAAPPTHFDISFPAAVRAQPVTGRVFVVISRTASPDPRVQVLSEESPPFFAADVHAMQPGQSVTINQTTPGYPLVSLKDLPAGDYYVEAWLNVYTEFHRADGHTIWAHMDWTGEIPSVAQGNLHSDVEKVHLDPGSGIDVHLLMNKEISGDDFKNDALLKTLAPPSEDKWIKVVKFQSKLLTQFWGQPMYLGATILLPKGYDEHPDAHYPVVFNQAHFYQYVPWEFDSDPKSETPEAAAAGKRSGLGTGYEFYQAWNSDNFPRFIMVTWQHPCPYFDDSYAVNSPNCGPFDDAIVQELIPYLESHFRMIRAPYARVLEGGSTGGWESLALQLFHPKFYGGAWVFDPDPIDFQAFQLVNIYKDENAFDYHAPGSWLVSLRPWSRSVQGQVRATVRDVSHYEDALGPNGRSDYQLDGWWAVFGPTGKDGYPAPLWDMQTGKIDPTVANYMRDHGMDLTDYARTHWPEIGPDLIGKLHFFVGDMDSYYLNLAVYRMQDFLESTENPHYPATFEYGRPMKGHGWHPMTWAELLEQMATQVKQNAPADANTAQWNY
jgi:hypothetical protein